MYYGEVGVGLTSVCVRRFNAAAPLILLLVKFEELWVGIYNYYASYPGIVCWINLFNESRGAAAVHIMAYRMHVITMRAPHYVQHIF